MRTPLLLAGALLVACSSSSTDASSGPPCKEATECVPARCLCNDGAQLGGAVCDGHCLSVDGVCAHTCDRNGGLQSASPAPNIVGSPECDAFCARWTKDCKTGCPVETTCGVYLPGCEAAARASAKCYADQGGPACASNGLDDESPCAPSKFQPLCGGDAGPTDAALDAPRTD